MSIGRYKPQSKLEKATKKIILLNTDEDCKKAFFYDLMTGGVAGGITGLIYYRETCDYYTKNKVEIAGLLSEVMRERNVYSLAKFFGNKFDTDDLLCIEENNQNLLAWFAFEQTALRIAEEIGIEVWVGRIL
jgi:hypothetical protein